MMDRYFILPDGTLLVVPEAPEGYNRTDGSEEIAAPPAYNPVTHTATYKDGAWRIRPMPSGTISSITYKADVWRRSSAEQAAVIDTEIDKLEPRLRRLWEDSSYLDHIEPEVAFFKKMLADTFGQAEADRIMAPSVSQA